MCYVRSLVWFALILQNILLNTYFARSGQVQPTFHWSMQYLSMTLSYDGRYFSFKWLFLQLTNRFGIENDLQTYSDVNLSTAILCKCENNQFPAFSILGYSAYINWLNSICINIDFRYRFLKTLSLPLFLWKASLHPSCSISAIIRSLYAPFNNDRSFTFGLLSVGNGLTAETRQRR